MAILRAVYLYTLTIEHTKQTETKSDTIQFLEVNHQVIIMAKPTTKLTTSMYLICTFLYYHPLVINVCLRK